MEFGAAIVTTERDETAARGAMAEIKQRVSIRVASMSGDASVLSGTRQV